jgi:hypothetical protein
LLAAIGRGPAWVGRGLDRAANSRLVPLNYLVRMLSSVWLGILWLFLTALYVGIGSGFASLRARLEMTDLQFFDWWPMVTLQVLMLATLIVVTLRRIPLSIYKLGVWTIHSGVVVLVLGCFVYFGGKYEGEARIYLGRPVHTFYDDTQRALYVTPLDAAGAPIADAAMLPIASGRNALPYYHTRLPQDGNGLDVPVSTAALAGAGALKDLTLKIVGYYPFADMLQTWQPGGASAPLNPAVALAPDTWLRANVPAEQYLSFGRDEASIGYVYHPSAEELADLKRAVDGPLGITVRVPKLGITRSYAAVPGKAIVVEGTPYTLTPGVVTEMPMLSKGFEGASSSLLMVDITRQDATGPYHFQRQVISRFPERSPDFITVDGKPKRVQERVDHDLSLTFQDARQDALTIVEADDGTLTLLQRKAGGGTVEEYPLTVGKSVELKLGNMPFRTGVMERTEHAVPAYVPRAVPAAQRPRTLGTMEVMAGSALEVAVGNRAAGAAAQRVYVPYLQFGEAVPDAHRVPTDVTVPGIGQVRLIFSSLQRALPFALTLKDFAAVKYAGAQRSYADYISTIQVTDERTGAAQTLIARLNAPAHSHGLALFQAAWDGHDDAAPGQRFSVLGIGNRPGVRAMISGGLMVFGGILFAFYVKPFLLQRRKRQLAAFVAQQRSAPAH